MRNICTHPWSHRHSCTRMQETRARAHTYITILVLILFGVCLARSHARKLCSPLHNYGLYTLNGVEVRHVHGRARVCPGRLMCLELRGGKRSDNELMSSIQDSEEGMALGSDEHRTNDAAEDRSSGGEESGSSGKKVGWEAVGAGVTSARELLGLPKKLEWEKRHRSRTVGGLGRDSRGNNGHAEGSVQESEDSAGDGQGPSKPQAGDEREDVSSGLQHSEEYERLDVDWDPATEDPYLMEHEAGRRCFTQRLLQRIINDTALPLHIRPEFNPHPDPFHRFYDRPRVLLLGPSQAGQELRRHLPRGFSVVKLNASASFLARVPSPPPLRSGRNEEEEEEEEGEEMQGEGLDVGEEEEEMAVQDLAASFANKSMTLEEYHAAMEPHLLKLRRRAEVNDGNGACELGLRLLHGKGVRKDPTNGVRYLMNAAAQGHCFAQTELGTCYARGIGLPKDEAKAVEWWKLASAGSSLLPGGVPTAMHNLACAYGDGAGVKKDAVLACHWHKQAARRGDGDSQYNLAYYYTLGKGVRRHDRKAAYWLLQAAKQYVPGAALELATRYLRAQGVRRCPEHAVRWLRKAASARTRARGSEAEQGGRDGEEERQQARRILAALAHDGSGAASNLKALDAMFPASLAPRRTASVEEAEGMQRAMRELQEEMGLQLQRARDRAAAAAHKRTRDDVVPGVHLGRRLEEALEDASLAAVQALSLKKSGGGGG